MPDTPERLARLEAVLESLDQRQKADNDNRKADNDDRRKRDHDLANHLMASDRTLQEIKLSLATIADIPARVTALEESVTTKGGVKATLLTFGLDTDKPTEGQNAITFAKEARDNSLAVKKHGFFLLITIVGGAALTGAWQAFKTAVVHP